jgi:hypothetical protein
MIIKPSMPALPPYRYAHKVTLQVLSHPRCHTDSVSDEMTTSG